MSFKAIKAGVFALGLFTMAVTTAQPAKAYTQAEYDICNFWASVFYHSQISRGASPALANAQAKGILERCLAY